MSGSMKSTLTMRACLLDGGGLTKPGSVPMMTNARVYAIANPTSIAMPVLPFVLLLASASRIASKIACAAKSSVVAQSTHHLPYSRDMPALYHLASASRPHTGIPLTSVLGADCQQKASWRHQQDSRVRHVRHPIGHRTRDERSHHVDWHDGARERCHGRHRHQGHSNRDRHGVELLQPQEVARRREPLAMR